MLATRAVRRVTISGAQQISEKSDGPNRSLIRKTFGCAPVRVSATKSTLLCSRDWCPG